MCTKPRIAIDTTFMDRRAAKGTAIVIRHTVEELRKYKDEFDITLIHREEIPEDPLYKEFKEIIIPRIKLPKFSGIVSEFVFYLTTKERFDIYYFSYSRLYPIFWLAPAKRIVYAAMDGGPQTAGYKEAAKGKSRWWVSMFFSRISAFIALSEFGKKGIVETYGVPEEKVHVVYNGVDARFTPLAHKAHIQKELKDKYGIQSPYILDVSRFDPHKNILNILDAYANLVAAGDCHASLVFVGGRHMPAYSDQVVAKIRAHKLEHNVYVAPFIEDADLPKVYAGAEYMVFPSLYEGFGLPVIEAMACGTPVLISNIDALVEISGGYAARVVDPYAVPSIQEGMRALCLGSHDPILVEKGTTHAQSFTWQKHGERIAALFNQIYTS